MGDLQGGITCSRHFVKQMFHQVPLCAEHLLSCLAAHNATDLMWLSESLASSSEYDHHNDGTLPFCVLASTPTLRCQFFGQRCKHWTGNEAMCKYMRSVGCSLKVFYLNIFNIHRRDISILVERFVASNKKLLPFSYQTAWILSASITSTLSDQQSQSINTF